jgi:SAM-dependent methyltransferase
MLAQESIVKTFKKYKKSGRLLDIGCGNGSFLEFMQRFGYDVSGVELNPQAGKFTNSSLTGRIFYKDLKGCGFPDKTFDIITLMQALEHVYNLGEIFQEIKRVLKDDGILYLSVPNADFFESRLFGPYYYNLEVPRHLYFFTKISLKKLMSKNGFIVNRFFGSSVWELVSTPTSLYNSLWSFFQEKGLWINDAIKSMTFFPLVAYRLALRLFFIYDDQNLKILCHKI